MAESWRGLVNAILYMVIYSGLDDGEAERVAQQLVRSPFGVSHDEQRAWLDAAVRAHPLTWVVDSAYGPRGEDEVRDFLRRVLERVDALRPQPGN